MRLVVFALLLTVSSLHAADLSKVDRTIAKEPKYAGKPRYCLLVFGREAKHRVWVVQDGATLYVDRNGNGDLTEADEKVAAKQVRDGGFSFEVGELRVGGKTHKGLAIGIAPLKTVASNPNLMAMPHVAKAVKQSPEEVTPMINLDVECESLKGGGIDGRVSYMLSMFDTQGVLLFASKPADAPIVHLDGPLQINFYADKPTWSGGRTDDTVLVLGTPGSGSGTFAMVKYEGTVPEGVNPKIEATYKPKDPAKKPFKELYELKERC